jgi:hypothetical protein
MTAQPEGGCAVRVDYSAEDACSGLAHVELHRSTAPGFAPDASTLVATDPASPFADTVAGNGIYYYRLLATDEAGNSAASREAAARVADCGGPIPPPAEAWFQGIYRTAIGLAFQILPADGADFHRIYRGTLSFLAAGAYDHAANAGTGAGVCSFTGASVLDTDELVPGSFYYLVVGVSAPGEGICGLRSPDALRPSGADLGTLSCP